MCSNPLKKSTQTLSFDFSCVFKQYEQKTVV